MKTEPCRSGSAPAAGSDLQPGIPGYRYADLYDPIRLHDLTDEFFRGVEAAEPALVIAWQRYRSAPGALPPRELSDLLIRMAPHVSRFLARLFQVEEESARILEVTRNEDPIFRFKVDFIRRRVQKDVHPEHLITFNRAETDAAVAGLLRGTDDRELGLARLACELMDLEAPLAAGVADPLSVLRPDILARVKAFRSSLATIATPSASLSAMLQATSPGDRSADLRLVRSLLRLLEEWCGTRLHDVERKREVDGWVSFRFPQPLDFERLVHTSHPRGDGAEEFMETPAGHLRRRDGFKLTDPRMGTREILGEVHYCVYCHERDKDSCSKGIRKEGHFKINPLGVTVKGCPLDEKISEMHLLRREGDPLAALALVMIDNPMCPGTGHRICNDCMKACIYQTQDPVNIPQIETRVLTEILGLPWGVEIYSLLTRWNPLNVRRPHALPYNGKNILVVGLGPAGYTLSHHLLNEGFGVVAIDGLKIEPLPAEWIGGEGQIPAPIRHFSEMSSDLDERILAGFGGVSEYGITVRWDKNFLTLLHLTLLRRAKFRAYGGVRFGGTLTLEDAWERGFDHVAIAAGAGRPTIIDLKNNLIRGIRKASDFLMALQLTGAFKRDSLANLQVRLPAVVIGGGLTAIDTATESAAYYPLQVEKIIQRYERLVEIEGERAVLSRLDPEEAGILREFLEHGRIVRAERQRARAAGETPDFMGLVKRWGGVTLAYRKALMDSPAYRLNHEEVIKCLEEGITFAECLDPVEAVPDEFGAVKEVRFHILGKRGGKYAPTGRDVVLPCRSLMVAAGTTPNITYEKEHPGTFQKDPQGKFFQSHRLERNENGSFRLQPVNGVVTGGFFTSYIKEGRFVSYYGDNHPVYAGSVVKAMASARDGFPEVIRLFEADLARLNPRNQPQREEQFKKFIRRLDSDLLATVDRVVRLTPTIVEVIVRAPLAARQFHPGQFYRLQSYESRSPLVDGTRLGMEGIALTGAWVDSDAGLLSLIILEMGASSRLCAILRPGDPVVVMGPTGTPTEIPKGEAVLLAGGGLGNAVLFSIARALTENGCRVIYFAGYKKGEDLFKREEIEASTDQVIWSTDIGDPIDPRRSQDRHFRGNIVQAMLAYSRGDLGECRVPLGDVTRIIAIGSDRMMAAVKEARKGVLAPFLRHDHVAIGSINSTMQCMMKEICAQCLQKHVDPVTGEETKPVFSCFNQDQPLDEVDFGNLASRLRMNSVLEKLSGLWLDHVFHRAGPPRI
ncbi:MAG TPA: FAD-dependent oxidoreductase [Candidatus Polarisedimenticolia bacterium]|nr:FAD-dependent oxidoreductase [Candidatus Polarisedimenticolia bacterium]